MVGLAREVLPRIVTHLVDEIDTRSNSCLQPTAAGAILNRHGWT